jgi:Flp pilus assembly protein TadG
MNPIEHHAFLRRSRQWLARFARARGGLAAIEFALLLPFMAVMYLGTFEIVQAISVKRQVTLTASTLANIVTQYTNVDESADWPNIYTAAATVLTPFSTANAGVTISIVEINPAGTATVQWSMAGYNGTARAKNSTLTGPTTLGGAKTYLVLGETTYKYTPVVDFLHLGTISLYSSVYMLPRDSTGNITCTSCP